MIEILTWISIGAGALLIILLILSIVGGFDLDLDIGETHVDTDTGGGGLGVLKGGLTFIAVASWVVKLVMATDMHPGIAVGTGVLSGLLAFWLLNQLLRLLLRNEENVNWSISDALFQNGRVYLRIPASGTGIVQVLVNGTPRELKAKSLAEQEIATGSQIHVVDVEGEVVVVEEVEE